MNEITLSEQEQARFTELKNFINTWINDKIQVGESLWEIKEKKLYRKEYVTFEDFCAHAYDFKKSHAYRLIDAFKVKKLLSTSPNGGQIQNERQSRELAKAPEDRREEVLKKAASKGPVTAKSLKEIIEELLNPKPKAKQIELDKTGFPIPEGIQEEWNRCHDLGNRLLKEVSSLRVEVKKLLEDKDPAYSELNNSVEIDLGNAYTSLKGIVPFAVCTTCHGKKSGNCTLCYGRGFISKFRHDNCVPIEVKTMRKSLCKS